MLLFIERSGRSCFKTTARLREASCENGLIYRTWRQCRTYSLNLDQIYYYKEKLKLAARVGFAINPHGVYVEQAYVLEQNIVFFKNPHHLELGIGITMQRQYNESCSIPDSYLWENLWYGAWRCGYRYQKQDDGFFLKAALTPVFMQQSDCGFDAHYFQLWAGVGVGMSF